MPLFTSAGLGPSWSCYFGYFGLGLGLGLGLVSSGLDLGLGLVTLVLVLRIRSLFTSLPHPIRRGGAPAPANFYTAYIRPRYDAATRFCTVIKLGEMRIL